MINNNNIAHHICSELKEKGWDEKHVQTGQILEEIKNMGEEAVRYYNAAKNDPLIKAFMLWDFGFAFFSAPDTIRYIYIKPSERNNGLCSKLVKSFKISGASPEIIHIMDKNDLLYDLKTKGFKYIPYSENEVACYDVELGYQINVGRRSILASYNRWTGEYFEVADELFPMCSLLHIRKRMKKNIKKVKTTDSHRIEVGFNGLWNC
ncbi:MAG: hypothetical protein UIB63_09260 [Methanobrevibacter sp.]|uniref:hypothetical protein n=1 Tax=Methanobrevibacter sp. TaxID=66852 RepID=UPI002E76A911|nr:hypothetical protein [Methanobrevibacter sp.]MEE0943285.1 hypothetical protein [Methanobrevibacter sp.]